jgi:hypothetical protein
MPTLESLDYERFSIDDADSKSLTLDEAVKKSSDLRRDDKEHFYRVLPIDDKAISFRVEKVPVAAVYAEFLARITKKFGRYVRVASK